MKLKNGELYDRDVLTDSYLNEYEDSVALALAEPAVAIARMEALAFKGSIMAILYVADAMRTGWIYGEKYLERAEGWYQVAVNAGSVRALHNLGLTQRDRGDDGSAIANISAAISKNYPPAMNSMATMKFRGEVVAKDLEGARMLWKRASSLGHVPSSRNLAAAYSNGKFGWYRVPLGLIISVRAAIQSANASLYSDRLR